MGGRLLAGAMILFVVLPVLGALLFGIGDWTSFNRGKERAEDIQKELTAERLRRDMAETLSNKGSVVLCRA
jgi:hypothetical protein